MWEFPVAAGVMLRAATEEELTRLIFEFRLRHGIAAGDIERELDLYYCTKWPNACHEEPSDRTPGGAHLPPHESLATRIARWVTALAHAMPKGGYHLADKETAETRAASCHGCPKNVSWRGGCASCTQATSAILLSVRQMRKTSRDGNLLGCLVTGQENQTAVWLPAPTAITADQNLQLPERCWMKRR